MESLVQHQAAEFRVALLLKRYKFGAAAAAKYLGKTRGLVQSWMQIGNNHYLAKEKIKLKSFEKLVRQLRQQITEEHLDYFLAMRLIDLELPVTFVSKTMELPTSTVRSWSYGKVPTEIKKFFYSKKIVDKAFNKLLTFLKYETTRNNIEFFIAIRLVKTSNNSSTRRRIGGRVISQILADHFGQSKPIPEKTISCWIDGKRKPWDAFDVLVDEKKINREIKRIIDGLTYRHMPYHISKALAEQYDWKYSKISEAMGLNKELVRGWIKKDRGNPITKVFVNNDIVQEELTRFLDNLPKDTTNVDEKETLPEVGHAKEIKDVEESKSNIKIQKESFKQKILKTPKKPIDDELNIELEQEIIYHLETIPTGVSSAKVLKSIMIDHQSATIIEIEKVLKNSKKIIHYNGKWMLKKLLDDKLNVPNMKEGLVFLECKKDENHECFCQPN